MQNLSADVRYGNLVWNCPLSEDQAGALLRLLKLSPSTTTVDIGCGWGELLLRATETYGTISTGLDTDAQLINRARSSAQQRQVEVSFINEPGVNWTVVQDRAICIGSSHAYGGTKSMLEGLAKIVPSGRVLVGDMCWEKEPTEKAREMFGEEVLHLSDIVSLCQGTGWHIMHLSTASQRDWDEFESRHRSGPREWVLENKDHDETKTIVDELAQRENSYIGVYRGQLSFAYLILAR